MASSSSSTALLSSSSSISRSTFNNPSLLPLHILSRSTSGQKKCCDPVKKMVVCSQPTSSSSSIPIISRRRDFMVFGASSSLAALLFPPSGLIAGEEVKMASMVDDVNAYSYMYPTELPSKKFLFKWVESRKPERYSSAAPLSPDARLRIVSERVDIIDNLIISISIGPPNPLFLKSKEKSTWAAKDVADSVLSDKSALRITSSQRMAESSILDARTSEVDGEPYWYYEYLIRKSPTKTAQDANLFRHYVSSTAERDGYLYSMSASTISKEWDTMGPYLERAAASFKLLPPTESYVPPFKDPWRFW